ncbi:hypothetical protein BDA99DRAFT_536815 [Phascolomyces articulosus]|uniref:Uncharacterized protein n=1 Tax=Phascolomyces articulosus TaxID=60185 RepID=A0AAD5PDZ6_9FUNG|nr:hypothetical protein BDA99DRAFT_536815 [Phascolomyces articulosus]
MAMLVRPFICSKVIFEIKWTIDIQLFKCIRVLDSRYFFMYLAIGVLSCLVIILHLSSVFQIISNEDRIKSDISLDDYYYFYALTRTMRSRIGDNIYEKKCGYVLMVNLFAIFIHTIIYLFSSKNVFDYVLLFLETVLEVTCKVDPTSSIDVSKSEILELRFFHKKLTIAFL